MQRTTHEILSLAAYLPLEVLPEGVMQELLTELRHDIFKDFNFSDENTELYFLKAQDHYCDYEVTATTVYSEDEPPEIETIYLGGLSSDERSELDKLIIERTLYALQHIEEI